jgi:hypothetical protein
MAVRRVEYLRVSRTNCRARKGKRERGRRRVGCREALLLIDLLAADLMFLRGGGEDLVCADIGDTPYQPAEGRPVAGRKWSGR